MLFRSGREGGVGGYVGEWKREKESEIELNFLIVLSIFTVKVIHLQAIPVKSIR